MGLSAGSRTLPRRASAGARMRGVRDGIGGPAHDPEGRSCDEYQRLRCQRRNKNAAGFCEGRAAAVQIPARDKIHRRIAKNGHRQDGSASAAENLAPCAAAPPLPRLGEGWGGGARPETDVAWIELPPPAAGPILPTPSRHTATPDRRNNPPTSSRA